MLKLEPGIPQIWRSSNSILIPACSVHILCTNIHIQCIHKLCIQKRFTVLCDAVWWLSVSSRLLAAVRSTLTWTAAWLMLWATVEAVMLISVEPALQTCTELVPQYRHSQFCYQQSVLLPSWLPHITTTTVSVELVEVELMFGVPRVRTVELLMVTVVTVAAVGAVFLTVLPHRNHAGPVK